jgi:hypothetical protein
MCGRQEVLQVSGVWHREGFDLQFDSLNPREFRG